jgi:Protein of unknown function (DUF3592)
MRMRSLRVFSIVLRAVPIILMLAGAIFFVGGLKVLVDSERFAAKAVAADGVVIDIVGVVENVRMGTSDPPNYQDVTFYHPVIRFVTARGEDVQFQAAEGSRDQSVDQIGESVRILYDPENPRDARLDSWFSRWGDATILISIGFANLVIGAVIFRLGRHRAQRRPQDPMRPMRDRPRRQADSYEDQGPEGGAGSESAL